VASATLAVQLAGVLVLANGDSPGAIYAGSVLFGLGIGNLTTLPALILAVEWPRERFAPLVALAVGINQLTFAFGPSLVGVLRDVSGRYAPALAACAVLQAIAAVIVLCGPRRGARA
jgi:cyanate permease